jgi:hypothetical protein
MSGFWLPLKPLSLAGRCFVVNGVDINIHSQTGANTFMQQG